MKLIGILVTICLLPTVFGCSCSYDPDLYTPLELLCMDYQVTSDVFAGRVINASCNCVPSYNHYPYADSSTNISCLSSDISEYFTTEIVSRAECDDGIDTYGVLSCDVVLNKFKPTGRFQLTKQHNFYNCHVQSVLMKGKCSWTVLHCVLQLVQIRMWLLLVQKYV